MLTLRLRLTVGFAALTVACAALAARSAAAQDVAPPTSSADEILARGQRLVDEGRYEEAILELRRGYELAPRPAFLRALGDAYDRLGAPDRALFYFRRYVGTSPVAPDRERIEARIRELEARNGATPSAIPPAAPPPPVSPAATPQPRTDSVRFLPWVGAGVAAVGVLVLVILLTRGNDGDPPGTQLGNQKFF